LQVFDASATPAPRPPRSLGRHQEALHAAWLPADQPAAWLPAGPLRGSRDPRFPASCWNTDLRRARFADFDPLPAVPVAGYFRSPPQWPAERWTPGRRRASFVGPMGLNDYRQQLRAAEIRLTQIKESL
jgi:hypothetical protein